MVRLIQLQIGPVILRWREPLEASQVPARKPCPPPLSVAELLDCLRSGWMLRWVPRSLSGISQLHQGQLIGQRDLWLDRFRHEDHPELRLDIATSDAFWDGLLVQTEDDDTGVCRYWLADRKHPSDSQTCDEARVELRNA